MIEERRADFERDGHAGAVNFGEDIVGQIRLDVDVLNAREKIIGAGAIVVMAEDIDGIVAGQRLAKFRREKIGLLARTENGDGIEISLERGARQTLKSGLSA